VIRRKPNAFVSDVQQQPRIGRRQRTAEDAIEVEAKAFEGENQ